MENERARDFQELSAQAVLNFFKDDDHSAYLLADETGLGKTITTQRVISEYCKNRRSSVILYIASNLVLAQENLAKLNTLKDFGTEDGKKKGHLGTIHEFDRLTDISPFAFLRNEGVQLYSITPDVSLYMRYGKNSDIQACESFFMLCSLIGSNSEAKIINEYFKSAFGNEIRNRLPLSVSARALEGSAEGLIKFDESIRELKNSSKWNELKDYSDRLIMQLAGRLSFRPEGDTELVRAFMDSELQGNTLYKSRPSDADACVKKNLLTLYEMVLDKKLKTELLGRLREWVQLKEIKGVILRLTRLYNAMAYIDKKTVREHVENINIIVRELESSSFTLSFECDEDIKRLEEWNSQRKKAFNRQQLVNILYSSYYKQYRGFLQMLKALFLVGELRPDLVILDEIQNYPDIFARSGSRYTESSGPMDLRDNIHLIINSVLGRSDKSRKVLMLSATPYRYYSDGGNDYEDDGKSDIEATIDNMSDMKDVAEYLSAKNGQTDTHGELIKKYSAHFIKTVAECREEGEVTQEALEDICAEAEKISKALRGLGISRVERPMTDYSPTEGFGALDIDKLEPAELLNSISNKERALSVRKFVSSPVYDITKASPLSESSVFQLTGRDNVRFNSLNDKKDNDPCLRARTKKLLAELFGEGDEPPLLFIPPLRPSRELKGPFKGREGRSKLLLFSLHRCVPDMLREVIEAELNNRLCSKDELYGGFRAAAEAAVTKAKENELEEAVNGHKVREELCSAEGFQSIDGFLRGLDIKPEDSDARELRYNVYRSMLTETAVRIIFSFYRRYPCFSAEPQDIGQYLDIVDEYLNCGCIEDVLREFFFLVRQDKHPSDDAELIRAANNYLIHHKRLYDPYNTYEGYYDRKAVKRSDTLFCSVYTSKAEHSDNLMRFYKPFLTPFFPFCFLMTSVAQEGFDFHWYCDTIVHWNSPSSPIQLLQREGRINRYNCFSLRKALINDCADTAQALSPFSWESLFDALEDKNNVVHKAYDNSQGAVPGLFPHFISYSYDEKNKRHAASPLPIRRLCMYYPLSEEYFRWEKLMKDIGTYRSIFGAARTEMTDDFLRLCRESSDIPEELDERSLLARIAVDLRPVCEE